MSERRNEKRRTGRGLPTIVIGGRSEDDDGEEWRFCVECAKAHLGLAKSGIDCGCYVCREERRVRGRDEHDREYGTDERVLRWLRRKERVKEGREAT
jgi:hypothetical protein